MVTAKTGPGEGATQDYKYLALKEDTCSWMNGATKSVKIAHAENGRDEFVTQIYNLLREYMIGCAKGALIEMADLH